LNSLGISNYSNYVLIKRRDPFKCMQYVRTYVEIMALVYPADVSGEGYDEDDEVVHGAADGERLGVLFQTVCAGEVDHKQFAAQLE
jgi:hypothetical protein